MFPADLTSVLTGATVHQLEYWRQSKPPLLVPEVAVRPKVLYSFRDVAALRTVVFLRAELSLQKVRLAFRNLSLLDLVEHPSSYRFGTDGKDIAVEGPDGMLMDLTGVPGQYKMFPVGEIFEPFEARSGRRVGAFLRPRKHLRVDPALMGGWPTVVGTRVPYDTVADLMADGSMTTDDVHYFYPSVPVEAVGDAVDFAMQVAAVGSVAA